jgi:membrane protein implicated in regulation of membrane protease activity
MRELPPSHPTADAASDWQSAIAELIAARVELIRYESHDVARTVAEKSRITLLLVLCAAFAWQLLLVAIIGLVSHFSTFPWWSTTLALALLHVALAWVGLARLRRPSPPAFPLTKEEFSRDRLWMQSFKTPKSKP